MDYHSYSNTHNKRVKQLFAPSNLFSQIYSVISTMLASFPKEFMNTICRFYGQGSDNSFYELNVYALCFVRLRCTNSDFHFVIYKLGLCLN